MINFSLLERISLRRDALAVQVGAHEPLCDARNVWGLRGRTFALLVPFASRWCQVRLGRDCCAREVAIGCTCRTSPLFGSVLFPQYP
jgi:hypothetical protein